jgi:hypothetical protein
MIYLAVRKSDGLVVNAIEWDGMSQFILDDCDLISKQDHPQSVWIGWSFIDNEWISPQEEE